MANRRKRLEDERKALAIETLRKDSLRRVKSRLKTERNTDPIEEFWRMHSRRCGSGFQSRFKQWKRPKTKDKDRLRQNLARFVFEEYPAPRFLRRFFCEISDGGSLASSSWSQSHDAADWYMAVARGQSLKNTALAKLLTRKEIHSFLTLAPSNGTINGNLWWTKAHSFGGSAYAEMIVGSRLLRNEFGKCARSDFWIEVLRFFADNPPEDLDDFNDYLDFLTGNEGIHSMRGRSLRNLSRRRDEWHMRLAQVRGTNAKWSGVDIPNTRLRINSRGATRRGDGFTTYEFWQIRNGRDLAKEGRLMQHCVYSYLDGCIYGRRSIWSVVEKACPTHTGRHVATIELSTDERIVQARGVRDSKLSSTIQSAITAWAKRRRIELAPYLF